MESKLNKIKNYVKENRDELLVYAGILTSYALGCCVGYKYCRRAVEIGIGEASNGDMVLKNIKVISRV